MWRLLIESDIGERTQIALKRDEYLIGRAEGCYVRLTEQNISRRHARFRRYGTAFLVEDLGSYNGTYVNGARIVQPVAVAHADLVQIGDYLLLVQQETTEPVPEPPPFHLPQLAGPATRPPRLVMLAGPTPSTEFPLTRPHMTVGRGDVDIDIAHSSVSRLHCEIVAVDGARFEVVDLGSANGLLVNGASFQRALLDSGDVLTLGEVTFKFVGTGETVRFDARDLQLLSLPQPLDFAVKALPYAVFAVVVTLGGYFAWVLARR